MYFPLNNIRVFTMKNIYKLLIILMFSAISFSLMAAILVFPFSDPVKEARFNLLVNELRCPKCQNNNLSDSNAPLAVDLKNIIYEKLKAGETNDAIVSFLKQRYGDFISYRPPVKPSTWLIWYGPFVFLLLGFLGISRYVYGRQKSQNKPVQVAISADSKVLFEQWNDEVEESSNNEWEATSKGNSI